MTQFCAYVQARPDTADASGIFYVGKGTRRRAQNLKPRNPHHGNVVSKYGAENILVGSLDCSSEAIAFDLEKGLIKCLRRMGVKLTNQTDGGEGIANPSQEIRRKIATSLVGTKVSPETRKKLSEFQKQRMTSQAERDKSKSFLGRSHTKESLEKMSRAKLGQQFSEAHRAKLSAAKLGKKLSAEHAKKVGRRSFQHTEETKRKISAAWRDEAHRVAASDRTRGKIWVNDGTANKRVLPNDVPTGFSPGRLPLKLKKFNFLK